MEKRNLRSLFRNAAPVETEELSILYEELKAKSRAVQRSVCRLNRRKASKQTREKFLKQPFEFTKKLFVEARSGSLECTKDELDQHIKETYSDALRESSLPFMGGLRCPTRPGQEFNLGDFKAREVDEFIRKAQSKSAPGRDGVSYK